MVILWGGGGESAIYALSTLVAYSPVIPVATFLARNADFSIPRLSTHVGSSTRKDSVSYLAPVLTVLYTEHSDKTIRKFVSLSLIGE